jgi:cytochrome P450
MSNGKQITGNGYRTLMDSMLHPPENFPKQTFPFEDLVEEALTLVMAGTDATANTLQFATWHFLSVRFLVEWEASAD